MSGSVPGAGPHGGDGARVAAALGLGAEEILDLSASMNPVAPDLVALVRPHLDALRRYPDPTAATESLADTMGVAPERLLLTNGGAEAIALVARALGRGWVEGPEFSLYARHLSAIEADAPRWRSDPHNPGGRLATAADQAAVWDEAFFPLATGHWTSGRADRGAVVLGSLTKLFACPGLRLGYVLVPPGASGSDLIRGLSRAQPQWSVNGLAAAALPALLAVADLPGWTSEVRRLRQALEADLTAVGLTPCPSDANYVLVPGAAGLRDRLARQGVLVRDCASFGLPGHVRIAVPDDLGRARLLEAVAVSARR